MFSLPTADPNAPPEAAAKLAFGTSAVEAASRSSTAVVMKKSQSKSTWLWQKMLDPVARAAMARALVSAAATDETGVKDERPRLSRMPRDDVHAANATRLILSTQHMLRSLSAVTINAADVDGRPARISDMLAMAEAIKAETAVAAGSPSPLKTALTGLDDVLEQWWACCEQYCATKLPDHIDRGAYVDVMARVVEVTTFLGLPTFTARVHGLKSAVQVAQDDYASDTGSRYAWRGLSKDRFLHGTVLSISRAWAPADALRSTKAAVAHDVSFLTALLPLVFDLNGDASTTEDPSVEAPPRNSITAPTPQPGSQPLRPASRSVAAHTPPPSKSQHHAFETAPFVPFAHSSAPATSCFPQRQPSASRSRPGTGKDLMPRPTSSSSAKQPDSLSPPPTLSKLVSAAALRFGLKSPTRRGLPAHLQPLVAKEAAAHHSPPRSESASLPRMGENDSDAKALVVAHHEPSTSTASAAACLKPSTFEVPPELAPQNAPQILARAAPKSDLAVKRIFWLYSSLAAEASTGAAVPSSLTIAQTTLSPRSPSPTVRSPTAAGSSTAEQSAALDPSVGDAAEYSDRALEGFLSILEAAHQRGLGRFAVDVRVYDRNTPAPTVVDGTNGDAGGRKAKKQRAPRLTLIDRAILSNGGTRLRSASVGCTRKLTWDALLASVQMTQEQVAGCRIQLRRGAYETEDVHDTRSLLLALLAATPERMDLSLRVSKRTRGSDAADAPVTSVDRASFTVASRPLDVAYVLSITLPSCQTSA